MLLWRLVSVSATLPYSHCCAETSRRDKPEGRAPRDPNSGKMGRRGIPPSDFLATRCLAAAVTGQRRVVPPTGFICPHSKNALQRFSDRLDAAGAGLGLEIVFLELALAFGCVQVAAIQQGAADARAVLGFKLPQEFPNFPVRLLGARPVLSLPRPCLSPMAMMPPVMAPHVPCFRAMPAPNPLANRRAVSLSKWRSSQNEYRTACAQLYPARNFSTAISLLVFIGFRSPNGIKMSRNRRMVKPVEFNGQTDLSVSAFRNKCRTHVWPN